MMSQQLDAELLTGPSKGLPRLANTKNLAARINACSAVSGDAGGTQAVRGVPFEQAVAALDFGKDRSEHCGLRQIRLPRGILRLNPARVERMAPSGSRRREWNRAVISELRTENTNTNSFYSAFLQCRPKMGEFGQRWKTRDPDPSSCYADIRMREIKCDKIGKKAILLLTVTCSATELPGNGFE